MFLVDFLNAFLPLKNLYSYTLCQLFDTELQNKWQELNSIICFREAVFSVWQFL